MRRDVGIKGPSEAEAKVREFIEERHSRVKKVLFRRVQGEGDVLLLEGEVKIKLLEMGNWEKSQD